MYFLSLYTIVLYPLFLTVSIPTSISEYQFLHLSLPLFALPLSPLHSPTLPLSPSFCTPSFSSLLSYSPSLSSQFSLYQLLLYLSISSFSFFSISLYFFFFILFYISPFLFFQFFSCDSESDCCPNESPRR